MYYTARVITLKSIEDLVTYLHDFSSAHINKKAKGQIYIYA